MKPKFFTILAAIAAMSMSAQTYYFDFGGSGTPGSRGTETTNPGVSGIYWNNIMPSSTTATSIDAKTTFENIMDSEGNVKEGLSLTLLNAWGVNGAGGLASPSAELLGDLAQPSATTDYAFNTNNDNGGRSMAFRGLDTSKGYRITIFGTRSATDARIGIYTFSGYNTWFAEMQVAGTGIGAGGENQNTDNAPVSDVIYPDAYGNILFYIYNKNNTYVPISLIKLETVNAARPTKPGAVQRTLMFDFGSNGSNEARGTTTPGNWNNIVNGSADTYCAAGTAFENLIDNTGANTGITLTTDVRFSTNGGSGGGGLASPDQTLLGDFAVATATNDYFYTEASETLRPMTFSGLNPLRSYRFYLFGTRNNAENRAGLFMLEGLNTWMGAQQVAGNNFTTAASQNDRNILMSDPIFPDKDGKIVLTVINNAKTYVALSVMKIEELSDVPRPDIKDWASAKLLGGETAGGTAMVADSRAVYHLVNTLKAGETISIEATDDKGDVVSIPTTGVAEDGIYTVTVDLDTYNVTFSPITYVCVEGSVVGGWNTTGKEMTYQGNGVWQFAGLLEGYDTPSDPGRFNFVLNKDWGQTYKRVEGSLDKVSKEGATKDIPLNPGNYRISLDLNNLTFAVANGADETDHARITVMGSSVPNGQGATDNHGYAYLYGEELAARYAAEQSTTPFYISNISINGNSSVNLLDRFDDLQREYGDYVIYGISLGNEGIHEATDKEAIANQYKTNLQKLITDARADGKTPVVMNNYTRTDFTADDYSYLKSVNREMGYWDVPSVNLLGAIDNGQGQWADGYGIDSDIYHPNDLGHHEFFYAMVPSMFDALASGKTLTMSRQIPASGYNLPEATSIVFEPEGTVHSFTLALSVDMPNDGLVAKVVLADGGNLTIVREGTFYFLYKDDQRILGGEVLSSCHIKLSQNYAAHRLIFNVDGQDDFIDSEVVPVKVIIGDATAATPTGLNVSEVMFYRSSMFNNNPFEESRLWKSSLELYTSLDGEQTAGALPNMAMSTNAAELLIGEVPVESVTLSKHELTLALGEETALTATILPETADVKSILWTSSNETVASVNEGVVKGLAEGNTTVTISVDGVYDQCQVTVYDESGLDNLNVDSSARSYYRLNGIKSATRPDSGIYILQTDKDARTVLAK